MKDSARYAKIVQWSDEDQCFVGLCPDLMFGGGHGDDEQAVFAERCDLVEDVVAGYRERGQELPPPTLAARQTAS